MNKKLDTFEAAEIIGVVEYTLRRSRQDGRLLGREGPEYLKMGRKVIYELDTINKWLEQFKPQTSVK